jgi:1-acyl-sn-glycerol-3-phosphate acyltransferase
MSSSDTSFGATAYAVYKTLEISVLAIVDSRLGRLSVERGDQLMAEWAKGLLARAGVELEVQGELKVARAGILMSNHQSHFDIPILYRVYPRSLRMIGKQELFRVPIWGRALKESGFVSVNRSGDRENAKQAMVMAAEALERGVSIWLAPEGTRSLDGKLGAFKKGGFRLALETGAPILPIAIDGSIRILPKHESRVHRGQHVRVTFGAQIDPRGRTIESLQDEVRAFLTAHVSGT